jgi:hypothetical protein
MTILEALDDPKLFGAFLRDTATWHAWRSFLCALFGLAMSDREAAVYRLCTGRGPLPVQPYKEAWLCCGRRAGKSFALALVAVFLGAFKDYRRFLGPGERATILVVATDRKQARTIFRYIRGLLADTPMLAPLIERESHDSIDLTNRVTIEVGAASFRSLRGYTVAAGLCDELAFWPTDDAAEPDYAVLDALRPGMATIPGAMLLCASSPYARRGALWDAFKRYHAKDDAPVLVWRAPTRTMNPTVPQSIIDAATERDPASAAAEYLAEFRSDIEGFVSRDVVEAAVDVGVHERPPLDGTVYFGFVDPSGGASDSMTMGIAHCENRVLTLDAARERKPPFSPEAVVADFAALLKRYRISTVKGDRYAGEWPRERFAQHGITYIPADRNRSEIYTDVLPELNSKCVALLDNPRIVAQFVGLERRTSRGGKDIIDHAPGSHDDLVNSVAGVLLLAKPSAVEQEIPICGEVIYSQYPDSLGPSSENPACISRTQRGGGRGMSWGSI